MGVAEHEGVADLEVLRLVDVRFLIDVLAVGLDGAQGASRLLRVLARRHAGGKGAADIALRVGKLGVAAEEQLVHQGVHFLFAEVRQTADLRLGGVQIVPRRRHLTAQALLLRLQRGDRPFVGAQLVGEGEQLLENGLLLGVVRRGDAVDARQNGAEVAVGVKDAAGDAYREKEHQQEKKLHGAASHGGVVVALGQEHRQRVGRVVPGGKGEGSRQTDEAAVGAGKGGERTGGLGGELLRRDEAEAAGGVRQQAAGDVQRAAGVGGEDARQMLDAGGLGMVGGEIGLVHGEAAETVDRAVRADVSSLTAVAPDQNTVLNVGSFVEPTIKGVKNEVLAGVLKYTITAANGATAVTDGDYAAATGSLATLNKDKAVSVSYTFTPSSGNYTGSKTGSFTVTAKDIEFTVNGAAASVGNALDIKTNPTYGDDWSDIVKIKDGVTITAKVGTNNDTDPSHFTLKQTGKPGVGSQAYTLAYNGTINGVTYSDVTVLSGTVTVAQKGVTITGLGAANKEYDGSNSATVTGTAAVAGKVGSDDVTVTGGTATFDNKNVGAGKTVTFNGYSLSGAAAGNYNLTAQPANVTAEITAKEVTVTGITATNRTYAKDNLEVTLNGGTLSGVIPGDAVNVDLTNAKGKMANANAGNGKAVTVTGVALGGADKGNYRLKEQPTGVTVDIARAGTPAAPTGLTGVKGNALSTVALPAGWTWVNGSTVMNSVGPQTFKANYTDAAGNYASATNVDVAVNVMDKTDVSGKISFNDGTLVYTGAGQKYETASISGITAGTGVTWTYGYTAGTGTLDSGLPKTVGTYTATVTYEDSLHYGTKSVTLTITQATPTGAPKFTKITSSGKTLGDAALVKTVSGPGDGFSVAGTVEWVDGSGAALADSTSVEANKSYGWKFTPTDSNYKSISGSVVVYTVRRVSHSGGAAADSAAAAAAQPTVYSGSRGESVKTLQERLNAKGYNAGSVDGIFGKNTREAVIAFQKANGLAADGIVGKLTWAKLYDTTAALPAASTATGTQPMVYRGSRGDAVRRLQELLHKKGFDCGAVDGIFGSKTYAAVMAFQKANGLGADGIVGPLTWGKLG